MATTRALSSLKDAQTALGGILNGVNTNHISDVIVLLKAQNNPTLTSQTDMLLRLVSSLEQKYLTSLDKNQYVYVTHVFAQAVYDGLTLGLSGH